MINIKKVFIYLVLTSLLVISSCSNNEDRFISGTFDYTENPVFQKIHVIKGVRTKSDSSLFRRLQVSMIMNNNRLFVSARKKMNDPQYFLESYEFDRSEKEPRLKFEKEYGMKLDSTYDFFMPFLYKSWVDSTQINIVDADCGEIYTISKSGIVNKLSDKTISYKAKVPHEMSRYSSYVYPAGKEHQWLFIGRQPNKGISIYKTINYPDSIVVNEVSSLNLDPDIDFWGAYLGCFAYNPLKKIGVYAYNYYPQLEFTDMTNGKHKIIKLRGEGYDSKTRYIADGLDMNIVYYRSISVTEKYIYLLYLGRKWEDAKNVNEQRNGYVYIMQYDWNGNPIKVIKTDHFGETFCVSDDNSFMLLYSSEKDNPVYMFELMQN